MVPRSSSSSSSSGHASFSPDAPGAGVEEKEGGTDEQGSRRVLCISLIDLALARSDPRRLSTSYLAVFAKTRQEVGVGDDGVDRTRDIQLMRVWQRWSAVIGGDVSWGVSDQLGKFMRVVPLDLEDTASILLGPARAKRMVKAQEELLVLTTLVDEVRASDDYRTLAQAQDEATAMYVSLLDGDRIVQVTNAVFDRLLETG